MNRHALDELKRQIPLLEYLQTLPAQQNKEMSVYPAPAERIEAAQKAIAGLRR